MADRFPIIIESSEQQIQELSAGDGLDLTKSGVVNANYVHSAGVNAGVVTATSFIGDGSQITNIPAGGGSLEATASGTLSDGSTVIVNTDGTVSVAAQTGSASPSAGSNVVMNSASTLWTSATYDSTSNRVVIAYRAYTSSFRLEAVVGEVNPSNNSITFGTPVVVVSNNLSFTSMAYDSTNDRVVITYMDGGNSNYGTAVVGDVDPSNNSITFGTPVVYNSARSDYPTATFDSANGKVVFSYRDNGNSQHGYARVGDINPSNNSISFPSSHVVFESDRVGYIGATYDSTNGNIVIGFANSLSPYRGKAVVATVSGTSISFGTPVIFDSSARAEYVTPIYDSSTNRIVIAYRDGNNTDRGVAVVGEVSGTSISFGTPVAFDNDRVFTATAVYDSANQKVVIGYNDSGNSYYGVALIATVYPSNNNITFGSPTNAVSLDHSYLAAAYDSTNKRVVYGYMNGSTSDYYGGASVYAVNTLGTNLTAENFIGISDGAYTNGQTATIQIAGSVDDAQSSLTPGQQYYVQNDGTLSTSAGNPSVLAGTAIATTKLAIG